MVTVTFFFGGFQLVGQASDLFKKRNLFVWGIGPGGCLVEIFLELFNLALQGEDFLTSFLISFLQRHQHVPPCDFRLLFKFPKLFL